MNSHRLLADIVLVTHALFVVFVVLGLVLILLGGLRRWEWVRNPWFRLCHMLAIAVVMLQAWLGRICPLTEWENRLRMAGGEVGYAGGFIQHWLHRLMYFDFPVWVFTLTYTLFAAAVLLAWFLVPPRRIRR